MRLIYFRSIGDPTEGGFEYNLRLKVTYCHAPKNALTFEPSPHRLATASSTVPAIPRLFVAKSWIVSIIRILLKNIYRQKTPGIGWGSLHSTTSKCQQVTVSAQPCCCWQLTMMIVLYRCTHSSSLHCCKKKNKWRWNLMVDPMGQPWDFESILDNYHASHSTCI